MYYAVFSDWGNLRNHTDDLGEALRWFDSLERATHLVGPTGITVADRRAEPTPSKGNRAT
jgi:hypothetical protein